MRVPFELCFCANELLPAARGPRTGTPPIGIFSRSHWPRRLLALAVLTGGVVRGEDSPVLSIEEIRLPALRIAGERARAHTQGLELVGNDYYVTARREDVRPQRAFLFRTDPSRADWDAWDITPLDAQGRVTSLDHPGGMQSDGTRLWIPLAESKRNGRSLIRSFPMTNLVSGGRLTPDFEFEVKDHIGAVAVAVERKIILGANWDTERVYVWDFQGRLQQTLTDSQLTERALGGVAGVEGRRGLAVQDWKFVGERLIASGLFRTFGAPSGATESRLLCFTEFLASNFQRQGVTLPSQKGLPLAREAMAISEGAAYFLPEDLGAANRLFRIILPESMKPGGAR